MQQAAARSPRKPPAPSPLVRRLERSLATLASYNARPPPVLSVSPRSSPRRPQSARPDSRRPVLSPRAPRPASAPAHRKAPSPSSSVLPSQYFSLLMGSDGALVEGLVAEAEWKLGVHPLVDERTGRPLRTPRRRCSALGPPPSFDGQPTYVRTTALPGSRRPPPPGAAELRERRDKHIPAPYNFEDAEGGAYLRRRSERPRPAKDSPRLIGEIDRSVVQRLGSAAYSIGESYSVGQSCSIGTGQEARDAGTATAAADGAADGGACKTLTGTAKVEAKKEAKLMPAEEDAAGKTASSPRPPHPRPHEAAARATAESHAGHSIRAGQPLDWGMLPPEVHEEARAVSAALDAAVMSEDASSEPFVLVMGVSEHACGHVAYLLKPPEEPESSTAAHPPAPAPAMATSTPPMRGTRVLQHGAPEAQEEWDAYSHEGAERAPPPAVESVRLKKRMAAIERKVERKVQDVCKYSSKIDDRAWLERWMAVDPMR